jgi:hypothetical protein
MRVQKIWNQMPIVEKTFIFQFEKAAMNAPRLCQLCKDCLTGIGHGAKVLTKRLHFFIFQLPKAEKRPLRTGPLARG